MTIGSSMIRKGNPCDDACFICGDTWSRALQQEGSWVQVADKCKSDDAYDHRFDDIVDTLAQVKPKNFPGAEGLTSYGEEFYGI